MATKSKRNLTKKVLPKVQTLSVRAGVVSGKENWQRIRRGPGSATQENWQGKDGGGDRNAQNRSDGPKQKHQRRDENSVVKEKEDGNEKQGKKVGEEQAEVDKKGAAQGAKPVT